MCVSASGCSEPGRSPTPPLIAQMASMLEGGKTPILTPAQLEALGFDLCAYPLSLLGVATRAMENALVGLKSGRIPLPPAMPSFEELQAAVGFPEYYAEEARYAVLASSSSSSSGHDGDAAPASPPAAAVEPDVVVEPGGEAGGAPGFSSSDPTPTGTIDLPALGSASYGKQQQQQYGGGQADGRQAKWLRVRISDLQSGGVKLETRFPAGALVVVGGGLAALAARRPTHQFFSLPPSGFLNSVAAFVPAVAGVDLEGLVRQAAGGDWEPSRPLLDLPSGEDRVEVFLEFGD